jgi:hypothetical protein
MGKKSPNRDGWPAAQLKLRGNATTATATAKVALYPTAWLYSASDGRASVHCFLVCYRKVCAMALILQQFHKNPLCILHKLE